MYGVRQGCGCGATADDRRIEFSAILTGENGPDLSPTRNDRYFKIAKKRGFFSVYQLHQVISVSRNLDCCARVCIVTLDC